MLYFLANNVYVRFDDIKSISLDKKNDKLKIIVESGHSHECPNGKVLFGELNNLMKIVSIKNYLRDYNKRPSELAKELSITPPAIINLFKNNVISDRLLKLIGKKHPFALKDYERIFDHDDSL